MPKAVSSCWELILARLRRIITKANGRSREQQLGPKAPKQSWPIEATFSIGCPNYRSTPTASQAEISPAFRASPSVHRRPNRSSRLICVSGEICGSFLRSQWLTKSDSGHRIHARDNAVRSLRCMRRRSCPAGRKLPANLNDSLPVHASR